MLATEIVSIILQVAVFTAIPFVVFVVRRKTTRGFTRSIGLYAPTGRGLVTAVFASTLFIAGGVGVIFLSDGIREIMINEPSVTGKLRTLGPGMETLVLLLMIAWVKTSLAEEILFRGFVAKSLIQKFGFMAGNITQAILFGLVHLLLFLVLSAAGFLFLLFIFLLSTSAGFMVEYINDRIGNGSIVPGWIAHALGNTVSYSLVVYLI